MNIYEFSFKANCPANGDCIRYYMRLETKNFFAAEVLLDACSLFDGSFHEVIADELYKVFEGRQTIRARHGGVEITTHRGGE